jgi:hypothetical protein
MKRKLATRVSRAAIAAVCLVVGSVSLQGQEAVDLIGFNEPGWNYLYTNNAAGQSVDPTAIPEAPFAFPGAGGIAIWALPPDLYDVTQPVVGIVYDTLTTSQTIEVLGWQTGPAPFHYGGVTDIPGGTGTELLQPPGGQRRTQYFRKDFVVPEGGATDIGLEGVIDDIGVFYIDGVEIFRGGNAFNSPALQLIDGTPILPGEVPTFDAGGSVDVGPEILYMHGILPGLSLTPGLHTFAVEVHQGGGSNGTSSSDMGMNIRLYGTLLPVPEPTTGALLLIGLGVSVLRRRR